MRGLEMSDAGEGIASMARFARRGRFSKRPVDGTRIFDGDSAETAGSVPLRVEIPARGTGLSIHDLKIFDGPADTTFFLGRETLLATSRPGMALWRERLFGLLSRNARRATQYFKIPPDRVCELGAEIEL